MQIDFGLGIIFFMYFLLRLIASENLFSFLFSLDTIIDLITLPPLLLSMFLGRTWIGLRFFRFLYIANLSNILVYVGLLSGSTNIRLTQVLNTNTNKKEKQKFTSSLYLKYLRSCSGQEALSTCWRIREIPFMITQMQEKRESSDLQIFFGI